ncbi:MAG: MYG1 family protein [Patescibacteria group bacterium]
MGPKKIITVAVHDGTFHADECFALAVLKLLFKVRVIRTRDVTVLGSADMRVDVGFKYDPATGDFDHHQPDAPSRAYGPRYAAFGLVWREFGERICGEAAIAQKVESLIVEPNDAADNGDTQRADRGPEPFTVAYMIETLNPTWQECHGLEPAYFRKAVRLAGKILKRAIAVCTAEAKSVALLYKAEAEAEDKRILVLDRKLPWQGTVCGNMHDVRYVVYDEGRYWSARSVPVIPRSLKPKFPFPQEWAGKHDQELAATSGVADALFCHAQRHIVTAQSRDGVIQLTKLALA